MSYFHKKDNNILLNLFEKETNIEGLEILEANVTDAAGEKHVPIVEQKGNVLTVMVGSVPHPMLEEHYIQGVYVETTNGGQLHRFAPGDEPKATFALAEGEHFVAAYEYCNLHGLWEFRK